MACGVCASDALETEEQKPQFRPTSSGVDTGLSRRLLGFQAGNLLCCLGQPDSANSRL